MDANAFAPDKGPSYPSTIFIRRSARSARRQQKVQNFVENGHVGAIKPRGEHLPGPGRAQETLVDNGVSLKYKVNMRPEICRKCVVSTQSFILKMTIHLLIHVAPDLRDECEAIYKSNKGH
jgi:hypothetical protein